MYLNKIFIPVIVLIFLGLVFYAAIYEEPPARLRQQEIEIYFSDQQAMYLVPETRIIEDDNDLFNKILEELIKGPDTFDLHKTIPEDTEILGIQREGNTLFVNFNQSLRTDHWGGSSGERITIYSIVNTLTQFEEIEKVRILILGEEIETLVGHMDLSRPLVRDEEIIN